MGEGAKSESTSIIGIILMKLLLYSVEVHSTQTLTCVLLPSKVFFLNCAQQLNDFLV